MRVTYSTYSNFPTENKLFKEDKKGESGKFVNSFPCL